MTVLALGLLIPLAWVFSIVSERATRRDAAVAEIGATWGGPQYVAGPVIAVPYTTVHTDNAGRAQQVACRVMFLPRDLRIDGTVHAETRARGIFPVVVYHAQLRLTGQFGPFDTGDLRAASIDWNHAVVDLGISDPRGLTQRTMLKLNGADVPMTGGVLDVGLFAAGLHADVALPDRPTAPIPFELVLDLNGTRDLQLIPNAQETVVGLRGTWPHPSFDGRALPQTREITREGFDAHWSVQDFARPFPSRWTTLQMNRDRLAQQATESAFGVSLVQPVDIYQQAERAVKYAALFIVLTFLVFFLWEIFHAALLHPVQYMFVGFALCVFYLLLVSLSEHLAFDRAYAISASATTALIAGYGWSVLGGARAGLSVCGALTVLYGFLYLLLRLEDYALLAGSIALFAILAFVMYVTRRMNWYDLKLGAS